jgi:hypothetical protein
MLLGILPSLKNYIKSNNNSFNTMFITEVEIEKKEQKDECIK